MSAPSLITCCLNCGSFNTRPLDDTGAVFVCPSCTLAFQTVYPADPLGQYDRLQYDQHRTLEGVNRPSWTRFNHDFAVAQLRLRQLAHILPQPGIHAWLNDFGCSAGAFLAAARRSGYRVRGIELDPSFCCEVSTALGVKTVRTADFLEMPHVYGASALCYFDVLEHLVDPVGVLRRSVECLTNHDGIVILEVPDLEAHDGPLNTWHHYRVNEHLTYWGWHSLDAMRRLHFPDFEEVHHIKPIPGKVQVAWARTRK